MANLFELVDIQSGIIRPGRVKRSQINFLRTLS